MIKLLSVYVSFKNRFIFLALELASPGNQHCARCIGTLSFPILHTTPGQCLTVLGSKQGMRTTYDVRSEEIAARLPFRFSQKHILWRPSPDTLGSYIYNFISPSYVAAQDKKISKQKLKKRNKLSAHRLLYFYHRCKKTFFTFFKILVTF